MKKSLIIVLAALLVLLPSIAALIIYMIPDVVQTPINISGTLYDKNNSYTFDKNNEILVSFFNSLEKESEPIDTVLDESSYDASFYAEVNTKNGTENYTLYFSLNGACYYTDDNDNLRKINTNLADEFLNSKYAVTVYEAIHTPALLTFSNESVIPNKLDLQYTLKNHLAVRGTNSKVTNEILTYYSSDITKLTFSSKPDICNLKVVIGNKKIFDGDFYAFDFSSVPQDVTVKYDINATWIKSGTTDCFGTASYTFYVNYSPAPTFSIDKTSLEAGEFLILRATNIISGDRVNISFSGGLEIKPRFFEKDGYYYAIIPFSVNLYDGNYDLKVVCGETEFIKTISISERNRSESSTIYKTERPVDESDFENMRGLISSIGLNCTDKHFESNTFINYEDERYAEEFYLKLGFGRTRAFEEGFVFDMIGIEFTASQNLEIPALGNGIVCASGEDTILGKYIVIDHGFGLKSWYCNISEATLSVGDEVNKGDIIAITGNSMFYGQTGFFLMTTVLDTPVSPYVIYEKNFTLP